jgi:hypothetical protein
MQKEDTKITEIEDVDILLTLNPHNWSLCGIFVDQSQYVFPITHIFGEPYTDLILGLTHLIKGEKHVAIIWNNEPGGSQVEIIRLKNDKTRFQFIVSESMNRMAVK